MHAGDIFSQQTGFVIVAALNHE